MLQELLLNQLKLKECDQTTQNTPQSQSQVKTQ
jgi:hypothetical protein